MERIWKREGREQKDSGKVRREGRVDKGRHVIEEVVRYRKLLDGRTRERILTNSATDRKSVVNAKEEDLALVQVNYGYFRRRRLYNFFLR